MCIEKNQIQYKYCTRDKYYQVLIHTQAMMMVAVTIQIVLPMQTVVL